MGIKMKLQLEKKENAKGERETKKMGMRGQTNQIWCYQPAEVLKKRDHQVKLYIYSGRASLALPSR